MNKFLLLICFSVILGSPYGCYVWRDNYLFYENTTSSNLTINIYSSPRTSFIKVIFLKEQNDLNPLLIAYTIKNFTSSFQNMTNVIQEYQIDQSAYFIIDNILHVTFTIKKELFETFRYFQFSHSVSGNFDQLNYVGTKEAPLYNPNSNFEIGWCDPRYLRLAGRIGSQNEYVFIILVATNIFLMILCIFFRDFQPIQSRGVGPLLCNFFLTVNLVADYLITNAITYEQYYYVDCFVNIFILYPCSMISIIIACLYYFKYLTIININIQKQKLIQKNDSKVLQLPILYRILKKLTTPFYLFLLFFTIIPIYYALCIIIFSIFGFKCGTFATSLNRFIFVGISAVFGVLILIFQIWDLIQNRGLICQCKWRDYFITNDPYQYRSEFLISPLLPLVLLIWVFPLPYPSIFRILFSELGFVIGMWIISVHPLSITIFRYFKKKKKQNGPLKIDNIFEIPQLYELFLEFAKHEWSIENVYCKKLILDFKVSNQDKKREIIGKIKENFLSLESQFELNITQNLRDNLLKRIALVGNMVNSDFSNDFLKDLEDEIMMNLNDIFMRFQFSKSYQGYISKMEILEKEKN